MHVVVLQYKKKFSCACLLHVQQDYFSSAFCSCNDLLHTTNGVTVMRIKRAKASDALEPRTGTGGKDFACQDSGLSQIFKLIVSTSEKILNNTNVVV